MQLIKANMPRGRTPPNNSLAKSDNDGEMNTSKLSQKRYKTVRKWQCAHSVAKDKRTQAIQTKYPPWQHVAKRRRGENPRRNTHKPERNAELHQRACRKNEKRVGSKLHYARRLAQQRAPGSPNH